MTDIKLIQRIRETAKALQAARDADDIDEIERLEDELYYLEEELEAVDQDDYNDKHQHGWY